VFVFMIALTLNFLDRQLLTLLATPIKRDLILSDTQFSLLVGFAFVIFYLGVGIPISRLVDRGPRKWIIGAGIAFWSLMTAACGLASSFWQLALTRMGVGIGESCNGPATYSITTDMMPRAQLARAISIINIGIVAGSSGALLMGGWLIVWLTSVGDVAVPLLGTLRPWQLSLMIVGVPACSGPWCWLRRYRSHPGRYRHRARPKCRASARCLPFSTAGGPPIADGGGGRDQVGAFLRPVVWAPSYFERQFGWAIGIPGIALGLLALAVSPVGLILGGWLADRLAGQGRDDAHMRVVLWASWGRRSVRHSLSADAGALARPGHDRGALFFGALGNGPPTPRSR
jgi:MFS family permease